VLELSYSFTTRPRGRQPRAIAVAWDALALLRAFDATEAQARLDIELAATHDPARVAPVVRRGELLLPAGTAVSWTVDLAPGAELDLGAQLVPPAERRLAVWLSSENGAAEPVAEIESAGKVRVRLPVERYGTARLTMAALRDEGHAGADAGAWIVEVAKVSYLSSPSASRAESR
jgi:hypothetical protein